MSAKDARKVVSKAVMDETFRNLLFSNPDKALAGYDLTEDEVNALRAIPAETIDDFANNLEERISMSLVTGAFEAFGSAAAAGGAAAEGSQASGGSVAMGGADATGRAAMGSGAYAEAMGSHDAAGANAMGHADAAGAVAAGSQYASGDVMGQHAAGALASGDVAAGSAHASGSVAEGQLAAGAHGAEGVGEGTTRWLFRLAAALGFRGASGGGGKNDMY